MKFLFQGDSITDAGRDKSNPHLMGPGYPGFAAPMIAARHPETDFEFINLGIGGDRTDSLIARWQTDCINIQPDFVSILIGVNDTWHRAENKQWLENEKFEANYRWLLEEIKTKTKAKIMMLEPFLLPSEDKDFFREDLDFKIDIVRSLAREYADCFVALDGPFAAACVKAAPRCWSEDGVHPNEAGARFIAERYADAFDKIAAGII